MGNFLLNLLWFVLIGWAVYLIMLVMGLLFMASIIGIPIGVLCFKKGQQWAFPFGRNNQATAPAINITNVQNGRK